MDRPVRDPEIDRRDPEARSPTQQSSWLPRRLVSDNDGIYVDLPIYALPASHTWDHSPTVTLLGDTAHLMPPLGVGVNIAMLDASDRALTLVGNATIDATIYAYEDLMFPRPSEYATMLQGHAADLVRAAMPQFE